MKLRRILPVLAAFAAACGGGDAGDPGADPGASSQPAPAAPAFEPPTGPMSMPDWFELDEGAQTVNLAITAGLTRDNNYWNYNGAIRGALAINVPEGYTVTIDFVNSDPNMAHSIGVSDELTNFTLPPDVVPVFAGAISENPGSMLEGTMPGESETIQFVADAAGTYTLVCYIPGHTAIGMWLYFIVTGDGAAGVQGAD